MKKQDIVSNLLNIRFPVIQGPMLGVTTPQMVAAISNAGGLGSLPVGGLSAALTAELIYSTKQLTSKPFAVNLFAHDVLSRNNEQSFSAMQDFLEKYSTGKGIPFTRKAITDIKPHGYQELVDVLVEEKIPVVSFTFGLLSADVISRLKASGSTLVGTATSLAEATALETAGIDLITAQGFEAGGHRGSFLEEDRLPQVGLFSLLPELADTIKRPLLAAGGITDKRTIRAAFALGASGVQVGTLFIPSAESAASNAYKKILLSAKQTDSVITKAFTGRWARGIKNDLLEAVEASGIVMPDYNLQSNLYGPLRAYGQQNNMADIIPMWAGQSFRRAMTGNVTSIFNELVSGIDFAAL
jgi:nitronate monooxygenase